MLRKIPFQNDHYYHIYNRGVEKIEIFRNKSDYIRFLTSIRRFNKEFQSPREIGTLNEEQRDLEFRSSLKIGTLDGTLNEKLVDIICYSLIPNHEHLILKQIMDNGISKFMHKLNLGYAMYFNRKYKRTGSLFQGKFRSAHIKDEAKLCWMSGYVNCNAEIHKTAKAENWIWSSYLDYIGGRNGAMCSKEIVLGSFKDIKDYQRFCKEVVKETRELRKIPEYLLE